MNQTLAGKKVLVLVSSGVDEAAMSVIQRELLKTGATVKTIGTEPGLVNSWNGTAWGLYFPVDVQINQALGADYDLLVVPPGARSIQKLSANPHSERILSGFMAAQKPVCLMGEAVTLPGVVAGDNVLTGNWDDSFTQSMIQHFAGVVLTKMAA